MDHISANKSTQLARENAYTWRIYLILFSWAFLVDWNVSQIEQIQCGFFRQLFVILLISITSFASMVTYSRGSIDKAKLRICK